MDGVFAPYLARSGISALYRISDAVSDDDAVLEPLSCVVGAVQRAPVRPGDRVAIIGRPGPMGVLFAMMYRTLGVGTIIMLDVVPTGSSRRGHWLIT